MLPCSIPLGMVLRYSKHGLLMRHALTLPSNKSQSMLHCIRITNEQRVLLETNFGKTLQRRYKANDGKNIIDNEINTQAGAKSRAPTKQTVAVVKNLPTATASAQAAEKELPSPTSVTGTIAPVTETRKYELKTKQGVLSITTTIEDSMINEVVFEKSKSGKEQANAKEPTIITTKTIFPEVLTAPALASTEQTTPLRKYSADISDKIVKKSTKTISSKQNVDEEQEETEEEGTDVSKQCATGNRTKTKQSSTTGAAEPKPKPKRSRVDFNRSSLERNFITPARAMEDFFLKPSDLEGLPKIKRRSPYEQEPPITVYWLRDVEAKAIEIWGSRENLLKETLRREVERKKHQQNIFTVKRRLREYRREIGYRAKPFDDEEMGLKGKSGEVVLIAIGINALNFMFKVCAWLYCGSHSMFAEAVHSLADTTNQLILAYGIHKSVQMADSDHPYGYANMRHVSSLISGVGIFCVGCGLSMYHGIVGLLSPEPIQDLFWAYCILGGSLVSEGATLLVAVNKLKRSAGKEGVTLKEYILSGKDPCVNVVLAEDSAAVASVTVAASCMALTSLTGNPVFDALGSLLVGTILGGVASFIIYTNSSALVGKSIAEDLLYKINNELEGDCMIRAIYDVKGIHMGNSLIRYKAELDFDGRELTRCYLDKQDMNELYKVVKSFQSVEELEMFLLTHGENIVDLMGGEIDRIELKLRSKFPEIRHCDLEVL